MIEVRQLREEDIDDAARVLAASMMAEPGYVAIMPDAGLRHRILVPLITGTTREAMEQNAAFGAFTDGRLAGVSLWLPPGLYPPPPQPEDSTPEQLPSYLEELDPDMLFNLVIYDDRCMAHFPDEPAWYLMYLGTDPEVQGKGIGSELLRCSLDQVMERETAPAYLETGTERNVRFYERFGFRVREAGLQLAPGSTPHWTMLRHDPVTMEE